VTFFDVAGGAGLLAAAGAPVAAAAAAFGATFTPGFAAAPTPDLEGFIRSMAYSFFKLSYLQCCVTSSVQWQSSWPVSPSMLDNMFNAFSVVA
jgi:hypothetical protein